MTDIHNEGRKIILLHYIDKIIVIILNMNSLQSNVLNKKITLEHFNNFVNDFSG